MNYFDLILIILLFYLIFDILFLKVIFLFILYEVDILLEFLIEFGLSEIFVVEDIFFVLYVCEREIVVLSK